MTLWLLVHVAVPTARKRIGRVWHVPLSPSYPCRRGRAPSWELLPVPQRFQDLGPRQALGVSNNGDSLWLSPIRSGRPVMEKAGPGTRRLGALHPGAPCHASAVLCPSALVPETGVLLSYQSPEGIWVAQTSTAFSARATQGPQAGVSTRCLSSCSPPLHPHSQSVGPWAGRLPRRAGALLDWWAADPSTGWPTAGNQGAGICGARAACETFRSKGYTFL